MLSNVLRGCRHGARRVPLLHARLSRPLATPASSSNPRDGGEGAQEPGKEPKQSSFGSFISGNSTNPDTQKNASPQKDNEAEKKEEKDESGQSESKGPPPPKPPRTKTARFLWHRQSSQLPSPTPYIPMSHQTTLPHEKSPGRNSALPFSRKASSTSSQ